MTSAELKGFGEWLRGQREAQGLSRAQVAAAGGPSISTQQNYEEGGRIWRGQWQDVAHTDATLEQLAKGLGIDPHDVFRRAGRHRKDRTAPAGTAAQADLPNKLSRLSPEQVELVERMVDQMIPREEQ